MIIFVADAFSEHYTGGAELTTEAIITESLIPINKVLSQQLTPQLLEAYKDSLWVFGNFANVNAECLLYAIKNLDYCVIEYDYKFCKYRSIKKHEKFEGVCDCHKTSSGKLVSIFLANSKMNFWMSKKQKEIYTNKFPFIQNNTVLNSIFSHETLEKIQGLDISNKNNKWIILNSPSWIKGKEEAVQYAVENNLDYELVWGLEYDDLLKKLSESRGLIFFPRAADTCPRLVMEAQLLGCELVLNDNVQHKDEEWFENKETTAAYLKTRSEFFWRKIEDLLHKKLKFSKLDIESSRKVKVIVPFYNAEKWIQKCVRSLKIQNYKNFECYLIDDLSSDNSTEAAKLAIDGDKRFKVIKNQQKYYALENISRAISIANCEHEDIIILLDGDDWLASSYVLSTLVKTYDDEECLLTYGSYVYNPGGQRGVEPSRYPDSVVENNSFRSDRWRASHLRSFKFYIWDKLDQEDLKDQDGNYYKMAYDQAIMLPLLEMAGEKSKYIEDTLYVYNKSNPLNVDKIKAKQQTQTAQEIRSKKKYKTI
tara:strand:- start:3411 stop:5021 length:1611 start_codon:yes stop_codon:yes gene_type:complete